MIYNGCQPAAKKVAVALESLIRSQFPRDNLYIVGFSFIAREYKPNELVEMGPYDHSTGTNMAHGLMLSRQLLARHRGVNKQIIMITDGGPTVWYEESSGWLDVRLSAQSLGRETGIVGGAALYPRKYHHQHLHVRG